MSRPTTTFSVYDTLEPSPAPRKVLLVNLQSVVIRRLGFTHQSNPTATSFTTYRESVVPVLLSALSNGYLVIINSRVTAQNSRMVTWLRSKLSTTTPDGRYSGILFTGIGKVALPAWFLGVVRPTPDSVVVDDYGTSSPTNRTGTNLAYRLSSSVGALWFDLAEVFPPEPFPDLNRMRLPGVVNVFVLLDSIPEITNRIAEMFERGSGVQRSDTRHDRRRAREVGQRNVRVMEGVINFPRSNSRDHIENLYVVKEGIDDAGTNSTVTTLAHVTEYLQLIPDLLRADGVERVVLHLLYYDVSLESLSDNMESVTRAANLRYHNGWDDFLTQFGGRVTRVEQW